MESSASDLILFLHIPKSAGTTVHHFLDTQFGAEKVMTLNWRKNSDAIRDYESLTPLAKQQLRAVTGHFEFGVHEYLLRPSTYITLLRDPVDRLVSFYYYALSYPDTYIHSVAATMSLDDFAKSKATIELDNLQVRLLTGKMTTPFGALTSQDVQLAKDNLRTYFSVVGVQDDVDGFLAAVCGRFGFPLKPCASQNKTPRRPPLESVPASTKDTIRGRNALDLEVYSFAKDRLAPQLTRWQHMTMKLRTWAHSTASFFPKMLGA